MKYCAGIGHGFSQYSTPEGELSNLFICNQGDCGGIQAWRHHIEWEWLKNYRAQFAEEHRWQEALGLPLTPIGHIPSP